MSARALLDDPVPLKRLEANAILHLNSTSGMIGASDRGPRLHDRDDAFRRRAVEGALLVAREVVEPKLTRTLYLCRLRNRPMTYVMEEMCRLIRALITDQVGRGAWEASLLDLKRFQAKWPPVRVKKVRPGSY